MVDLELDTLKTLFKDSAIMSEIVTLDSTGQANLEVHYYRNLMAN